jgi:hypothetical protein
MLLRNIVPQQLFAQSAGSDTTLPNPTISNILRANPFRAIFYPDFCKILEANPSLPKDLASKSALFFNPDQSARALALRFAGAGKRGL